jgi:NTE family protein
MEHWLKGNDMIDREQAVVDESVETAPELLEKLAVLPPLSKLAPRLLRAVASQLDWFGLPGGQVLFNRGDNEDSLYIVLSGRLGAFLPDEYGNEVLVRQMTAGETVGEMALLSGLPRSATVAALRDSELVRLSKEEFDVLIEEHPHALRFITDLLVSRLQQPPRLRPSMEAPGTVVLVPLAQEFENDLIARPLAEAFGQLGLRAIVLNSDSVSQPAEWFSALERDHDIMIFRADFEATAWTRLCLRQAERLVLIGSATRPLEGIPPAASLVLDQRQRSITELVLYRTDSEQPSQTLAMISRFPMVQHHHVRSNSTRDFRRLARMISGRAIGLVLSGGGARGMSHIGVIRALSEAGFEVDLFGGSSMGSIVAAGAALAWTNTELTNHMREAFCVTNPVSDYTLPLVALFRGKRTTDFLQRHLENNQIEDCVFPYFCVSTNLTTASLKVHRTGPLWRAARASIAIPGVLPPVIEESEILVDGGVLNNLPTDVMSGMRRGPVVACDVSRNYGFKATIDDLDQRPLWQLAGHARRGTPNIITLLMAAGTMSSYAHVRELQERVDMVIQPRLSHVNMLDWKSFDLIVEEGYRSTMELLEEKKGVLLQRQ